MNEIFQLQGPCLKILKKKKKKKKTEIERTMSGVA
jgi:hypothetical protein